MAINTRLRGVIIAGACLAVVAGVGIGVATASPSTRSRYVTASAGTGDVTQTYTASGTISRTNTAEASFTVDGTVSSVKVAVGAVVDAGDVLAVVKKGPLQLAVLDAETAVAEARATLYAAKNPSPTTTSSGTGSTKGSGSTGGGSSPSGSGSAHPGGTTVTIDPTALLAATTAVTTAVTNEKTACAPVFGAVPDPEPTASATASGTPTQSATATASPTHTTTASPPPTASTTPSATATTSATPTASPSATIKDQQDTIESNDPTEAELKACGEARATLNITTRNLQTLVEHLVKPAGSKSSGTSSTKNSSTTTSSGSVKSGSTTTVSAAQVASAEAKLLAAEQQLQSAQGDLDNAELLAPISGTVGTVGLANGNSASAGSVTIVGAGNAQVSFELPLKTRAAMKSGQQVSVAPAGSTRTLTGKVTAISAVETSGTAGDAPTYTTLVTVSDPDGLLASGAKASVTVPVAAGTNAVRVPASAITPTGTGTATVSVLESGSETAKTVEVKTGAVGGGWVQITSGLTAGQIVVLADNTAALPSNTSNNRRTTSTTPASASPSAAAAQPSSTPSATPSR